MKVLVTGASGFLGRAVAEELVRAGHDVTAAGRRPIEGFQHTARFDLADSEAVAEAVAGHDSVVHVAARTGVWGKREDYFRDNVEATRNILAACMAAGVGRLVATSSPSVCFDGTHHVDASNDLPYAKTFLSPYPETKAIAEREVLEANGTRGLHTCALRPHLIVGPGDPHLIPRLVERARKGRLRIVGDGANEVSLTWIGNAARAHRMALEALEPGAAHAGKAYFLGQADSVRLWDWIAKLLEDLGEPGPGRAISRRTAERIGVVCESIWKLLRLSGEPPMTRFIAAQLSTSHSYDLRPAMRDFSYHEETDTAEATRLLVEHWLGEAS